MCSTTLVGKGLEGGGLRGYGFAGWGLRVCGLGIANWVLGIGVWVFKSKMGDAKKRVCSCRMNSSSK